MIAISTSPPNLSMARKFNTWYSVCDGYLNDSDVWISNGKKRHGYPQPGDDVYIYHLVTFPNLPNVREFSLHNVYVEGTLAFDSGGGVSTFSITGDLQANGVIDMTGAKNIELDLYGVNNYINTFIAGEGTLGYKRLGDQDIMNLPYCNLIITGTGNKNIYDALTIGGTTIIGGLGTEPLNVIKKTFSGKLTFVGALYSNGSLAQLDNTINADVEFQGGINVDQRSLVLLLGNGNLYFNGTQSISVGGGRQYENYNNCLIKGSSILTIEADPNNSSPFVVNGSLNGETPNSTLINLGDIWQTSPILPMATGIYNYNGSTSSGVGYLMDEDYILPYLSYEYLYIGGKGTKSLGNNVVINRDLNISNGSIDLSSYDFIVNGSYNSENSSLTKNSSLGSTVFGGLVNLDNGGSNIFSFNKPCTVEFQGGIEFDMPNSLPVFTSGVLLKFTTNDQVIDSGHSSNAKWDCDILISGAITLTNQDWGFNITGTINGDDAASTFNNMVLFGYSNSQQPMQTGRLLSNSISSKNIFLYELNGDQDIAPGVYSNLVLQGNGSKKLLNNVSVLQSYTLTSPAVLNYNGFTLTNP